MKLTEIHEHKGISAKPLSASIASKVIAIQILAGEVLKEHVTNILAVLVCVLGEVEYEDENGHKTDLKSGDFIEIKPMVKHWLNGKIDAQLLLMK